MVVVVIIILKTVVVIEVVVVLVMGFENVFNGIVLDIVEEIIVLGARDWGSSSSV